MLEESERDAGSDVDARGWLRRGRLLAEAGNAAGALRAYDAAALLEPGLAGLERARAEACLEAGLHTRGLEAIDRHLLASPDDPRGLAVRARLLARIGRHEESVRAWDRLFAGPARPEPDHVIERARASVAAGDLGGALRGLDAARARIGAVPAIDHLAVDLEVERGDHDAALRRIERASASRGARGTWELRRAEVLEAAARRDEARTAYAAVLGWVRGRRASGRPAPPGLERRAADGLARTGPAVSPAPVGSSLGTGPFGASPTETGAGKTLVVPAPPPD